MSISNIWVFAQAQNDAPTTGTLELLTKARSLGGTVSGEHGVGQIKRGLLPLQYGEAERALMARVKQAFDPLSILNPGRGF